MIAVMVLVGLIHHAPTFRYQWEFDRNPVTDRMPEEADTYGMKIAHLVLPIPDHNLTILANIRDAVTSRPTGRAKVRMPARWERSEPLGCSHS